MGCLWPGLAELLLSDRLADDVLAILLSQIG
jgi:hypothetical protein